jgi:histidinol dehydrogenase
LTREGLAALIPTITTLAQAEGLTAHALAATIRFENEGDLRSSEREGPLP